MAVHGEVVIVVIPMDVVGGQDMSEFITWVNGMQWNSLAKYNCYHLHPGDAVFLPFGSYGMISGSSGGILWTLFSSAIQNIVDIDIQEY